MIRRLPVPLALFAAAALGAGIGRAVVTTYLPFLLERIRDAPGLIGTVMLVNAVAGFGVPLVVGIWSDRMATERHGRRRPFIFGGSVVAAGGLVAVALGSGTSYVLLAAAGAVVYVGLNAVTTAHRAVVPEAFKPGDRATATSAQELALLVGTLIGVAVGGALTTVSPWMPFVFAAAAVPLLALPTLPRIRDRSESAGGDSDASTGLVTYYLRSSARPGVRAFLLAQILWVLGYAALPAFFILYADKELGLNPSAASGLLVAFGVVTAAAVVFAGRARNTEGHKSLLAFGVALMGAGFLGVAIATDIPEAAAGLLAAAAGFGLVSTLGFPLFSAMIPPGEAGGYTALYFSVRSIASAIALPAAGWAIAMTGSYRALFVFGGAATLLALVPLWRVGEAGTASARAGHAFQLPSRRFVLSSIGILGSVYAGTLASAHLIGSTSLQRLDEALFRAVNQLGPGPEVVYHTLNPHFRNYVLLGALAVAAAAVTDRRRVPSVLGLVGAAALLAWVVLEGLYAFYDRPRPEETLDPATISLSGRWDFIESFPSGHMAITAALAVATMLAFPRLRLALWTYIVVVAFTRVTFGAHFPLDTVAGVLVGYVSARTVWAAMVEARIVEPAARRVPVLLRSRGGARPA